MKKLSTMLGVLLTISLAANGALCTKLLSVGENDAQGEYVYPYKESIQYKEQAKITGKTADGAFTYETTNVLNKDMATDLVLQILKTEDSNLMAILVLDDANYQDYYGYILNQSLMDTELITNKIACIYGFDGECYSVCIYEDIVDIETKERHQAIDKEYAVYVDKNIIEEIA